MKAPISYFTLIALLPLVSSLSIQHRQDGPARVVGLELQRSEIRDPVAHDKSRMRRRSGTVEGTLDNLVSPTIAPLN